MPIYNIEELKKILKPGDVINVHGDSLISKIIRVITQSYWNHSVMYIGDGKIIGANARYVEIEDLNKYKNHEIRIYRHKYAKKADLDKIVAMAMGYEGRKYDYWQLLYLGWLFITGKRGNAREIGSKNRFICSELVAKPYYTFGYPVIKKYDYTQISPADFDLSKNFKRLEI